MTSDRSPPAPQDGSPKTASVSLPVLAGGNRIKPSRNARRRAAVLIVVNLLIIAHVVQWLITGMTLSPVEPSEAMDTLRDGVVNTGFVFLVLAIVLSLIFGRFFCGWACHVVALQDLCLWMMKRAKIHPKPWRTRLLVLMPLVLALYMFVWPVFHRAILTPLFGLLSLDMPLWLGRSAPLTGFSTAFIVDDFWSAFPPWFIAVPFLLVCGFGCVYFLGSKGFCTYGCPYGGIFTPVDRISPGRVKVNEDCDQSGHCTAACTSNVRVHEEVRDFGMVVDPGCMKCLDCVSVCPNGALSFGFAAPSVLAKPRDDDARTRYKARKKRTHAYDLSWPEEIVLGLLFLALTFSYRGMLNAVPLLMAAGVGAIATFFAWKLWRMLVTPDVRLGRLQVRRGGRVTRTGMIFALLGSAAVASGVWSGMVRYHLWRGSMLDASLTISAAQVFAPGYTPDAAVQQKAERAAQHYKIASPPSQGGFGWTRRPSEDVRYAWLLSVSGRFAEAEAVLVKIADGRGADMDLIESILLVMQARGASGNELRQMMGHIATRQPQLLLLQVLIARDEARSGREAQALTRVRRVLAEAGEDMASLGPAVQLMATLGRVDEALVTLNRQVEQAPRNVGLHLLLGMTTAASGDLAGALAHLESALLLAPDNPAVLLALADLYEASGDAGQASRLRMRVQKLQGNQ